MIENDRSRIALKLLALASLIVCLVVFSGSKLPGSFASAGQGKQKVIEKAFSRNDVVEFSEIKVSQQMKEAGKGFDADDDWLSKTYVKVKNISNKPIVFLEVAFDFPQTKATGSEMSYRVAFGQRPGSKLPQYHDPIFMPPGESLEIQLDPEYRKLKSFVERRHPITEISKLDLSINFVIFADKTAWAAGYFLKQDPKDPDHYINIGENPEPIQ